MYSPSLPTRITLLALLSASTFYFIYKSRCHRGRRLKTLNPSSSQKPNPNPNPNPKPKPKLFFISQIGTSKALSHRLLSLLTSHNLHFDLVDPQNYEPEDLSKETLVLFVASTWEDGKPPQNGQFFTNWLSESADDFRVGSLLLSRCRFAVFGVGSGAYGDRFNSVGKELSKKMRALGGIEILPLCSGDVDSGDVDNVFEDWSKRVIKVLSDEGHGVECGVSDDFGDSVGEFGSDESEGEEDNGAESGELVDIEDIAGKAPSRKSNGVIEVNGKVDGKRDMVTPVIRASLEKQVRCMVLGKSKMIEQI